MANAEAIIARTLARLRDPTDIAGVERQLADLTLDANPLVVLAGAERMAGVTRLGMFSGAFNPPTLAHLALAQAALDAGDVERVLLCISQVTVDKERMARAPLVSRLIVLSQLAARLPAVVVGVTAAGLYADQARALHQALPAVTDRALLMGFDKIVQIFEPHYYRDFPAALRELFAEARLLVAPRGGAGAADLAQLVAQPAARPYGDRVRYLALDPHYHDLSSTTVRARITQGLPITDLVPPEAVALVHSGAYA